MKRLKRFDLVFVWKVSEFLFGFLSVFLEYFSCHSSEMGAFKPLYRLQGAAGHAGWANQEATRVPPEAAFNAVMTRVPRNGG